MHAFFPFLGNEVHSSLGIDWGVDMMKVASPLLIARAVGTRGVGLAAGGACAALIPRGAARVSVPPSCQAVGPVV